jgi:hypothetical protein
MVQFRISMPVLSQAIVVGFLTNDHDKGFTLDYTAELSEPSLALVSKMKFFVRM